MAARPLLASLLIALAASCGEAPADAHLTFSGSAVGMEGVVIRRQLSRFADRHPGLLVELRVTPDAADARHQLYVQWLNARAREPDVLQLDIIWTAEFAAAGWILPLSSPADVDDFFEAAIDANTWRGSLYALPWFVDAGLLYWRRDLMDRPPDSLEHLRDLALDLVRSGRSRSGLVWQGARYEGLTTVFLEHLTAFGGGILDDDGEVIVDRPAAVRALTYMRDSVATDGFVPRAALTWQEEHARFAFQNGDAAFMRNWPYAWTLLETDPGSKVAGQVGVVPLPPSEGGRAASALGGAQLAINRHTREPALAAELIAFLAAPEQMLERAQLASQLPARRSLYTAAALDQALPIPVEDMLRALDASVARPVTPIYSELSELLQVHVHRALSGQDTPEQALREAAREIQALLDRTGLTRAEP